MTSRFQLAEQIEAMRADAITTIAEDEDFSDVVIDWTNPPEKPSKTWAEMYPDKPLAFDLGPVPEAVTKPDEPVFIGFH